MFVLCNIWMKEYQVCIACFTETCSLYVHVHENWTDSLLFLPGCMCPKVFNFKQFFIQVIISPHELYVIFKLTCRFLVKLLYCNITHFDYVPCMIYQTFGINVWVMYLFDHKTCVLETIYFLCADNTFTITLRCIGVKKWPSWSIVVVFCNTFVTKIFLHFGPDWNI